MLFASPASSSCPNSSPIFTKNDLEGKEDPDDEGITRLEERASFLFRFIEFY